MISFYSPCRCRNFHPKVVVTNEWRERDENRRWVRHVRYQIVCKHCGRHEPKREQSS